MLDLRTASEVFCECFAFGRSITHPCLVTEHGPLLIMHDAPRKGKQPYRAAEVVAPALPVREVLEGIASFKPGRYLLSAIQPGDMVDQAMKAAYKEAGFRLMRTEAFMAAEVSSAPRLDSVATIRRVTTLEEAELLYKAKGRPATASRLADQIRPQNRQYYAELEGEIVGWVRSVQLQPKYAWVASMYVKPEQRRKGIGKALLSHMIQEDRECGVEMSVLLATNAGAMLYPALGYQQIGTLHLFAPPKK